ncbi:FMN-dependent oxidoreductase (nitrilotriacetate monooxygenase family) [Pseudochelatococcus lubricantis]|uniref:FMN-dependent oxidoreductase (Nitrilotriacetate monooxygenase family) n=1 Tax=Pseudochelatococcus lubricantis TaxID=1538102 RepID=A0ABX0V3P1_9HYPH|nr:NtaA/DmoA family FMN-dependent monooxygenase [Pseudochelatococcus lubricantis]NIJ59831.1 FMN-dependent oxidoreductase (nitrilotriacetate monooxygenase family) [Pseudochelatococcus lubricantis]
MTVAGQLHIGLCLSETWLLGRGPDAAEGQAQVRDPAGFYAGLARAAEKAKLDFVFKPDTLVIRSGIAAATPAIVGLDVTVMLASIARETDRIGLVTTASTTFNPPYVVARQIQSLHWISNGRAGWNIVTSIEGAENFGDTPMPPTDVRYRKAREFTDVVRRLWQSYPLAAPAGAANIAPVGHRGEFFSVAGPLNVPAHPAGPPPLFQAGASDIGREFAASVADATFASTPDMGAAIELRADLRSRAARHGRSPDAVRVLPGLYFFLAATREEAWEMHRRAHAHLTRRHRCDAVKSILGLDIGHLPADGRVTPDMLPASGLPVRSRTHADLLRRFIALNNPTVEELLSRPEVVGSAHWVSVGTVDDVLGDIIEWHAAGAIDGFIALPGGSLESLALFLDELVPALAERGLFRKDYEGSTLRGHLGMG